MSSALQAQRKRQFYDQVVDLDEPDAQELIAKKRRLATPAPVAAVSDMQKTMQEQKMMLYGINPMADSGPNKFLPQGEDKMTMEDFLRNISKQTGISAAQLKKNPKVTALFNALSAAPQETRASLQMVPSEGPNFKIEANHIMPAAPEPMPRPSVQFKLVTINGKSVMMPVPVGSNTDFGFKGFNALQPNSSVPVYDNLQIVQREHDVSRVNTRAAQYESLLGSQMDYMGIPRSNPVAIMDPYVPMLPYLNQTTGPILTITNANMTGPIFMQDSSVGIYAGKSSRTNWLLTTSMTAQNYAIRNLGYNQANIRYTNNEATIAKSYPKNQGIQFVLLDLMAVDPIVMTHIMAEIAALGEDQAPKYIYLVSTNILASANSPAEYWNELVQGINFNKRAIGDVDTDSLMHVQNTVSMAVMGPKMFGNGPARGKGLNLAGGTLHKDGSIFVPSINAKVDTTKKRNRLSKIGTKMQGQHSGDYKASSDRPYVNLIVWAIGADDQLERFMESYNASGTNVKSATERAFRHADKMVSERSNIFETAVAKWNFPQNQELGGLRDLIEYVAKNTAGGSWTQTLKAATKLSPAEAESPARSTQRQQPQQPEPQPEPRQDDSIADVQTPPQQPPQPGPGDKGENEDESENEDEEEDDELKEEDNGPQPTALNFDDLAPHTLKRAKSEGADGDTFYMVPPDSFRQSNINNEMGNEGDGGGGGQGEGGEGGGGGGGGDAVGQDEQQQGGPVDFVHLVTQANMRSVYVMSINGAAGEVAAEATQQELTSTRQRLVEHYAAREAQRQADEQEALAQARLRKESDRRLKLDKRRALRAQRFEYARNGRPQPQQQQDDDDEYQLEDLFGSDEE